MKITVRARKSFTLCSFVILLLTCLAACRQLEDRSKQTREWMASGKIKILSTTAMINDIVQNIAGDKGSSIVLIQGNLDPHSYQLVKGDDEKLKTADVIFYNGLGLEHGASLQHHLEKSTKAIALGNLIQEAHPGSAYYVQGQIDPHIWMDVSLFMKSIPFIVNTLSQNDPENGEYYRKKGAELAKSLKGVHEEIRNTLQRVPPAKRFLVTSHDAFNYFSRAYLAEDDERKTGEWENRFKAPEGLAPDNQLSSSDIQSILNHLEQFHINVIFPESNVSQDSIRKIIDAGKEKGIDVIIAEDSLYGDAMGPPGSPGDTYPKMLEHNAGVIEKYLNM
jgi:manganese/zinc/iron transport system substrate-binding protein